MAFDAWKWKTDCLWKKFCQHILSDVFWKGKNVEKNYFSGDNLSLSPDSKCISGLLFTAA